MASANPRRVRPRALAVAAAIAASGCAVPLRSDGRWTALASEHFRVLTDADPVDVAREVPRLETVLAGIGARVRPGRPLPARVDLLWLRRRDGLEALGVAQARGYYLPHQGDNPTTPPLVVVGGAAGRDVEQALVHELAHVFFVDALPGAPAWLAEGMAAWWDTLDIDARTLGVDRESTALHWAPVEGLLAAGYARFHDSGLVTGFLYSGARTLVAMLATDPELAPRLRDYLGRLQAGEAAPAAWAASFAGIGTGELQARYDRLWQTPHAPLPLAPWHGAVTTEREPPPVVERWLARARPWDSPAALAEAGRALARAGTDDSAERHYWSAIYDSARGRFDDAAGELRAALGRDPSLAMAASALVRVEARRRARR